MSTITIIFTGTRPPILQDCVLNYSLNDFIIKLNQKNVASDFRIKVEDQWVTSFDTTLFSYKDILKKTKYLRILLEMKSDSYEYKSKREQEHDKAIVVQVEDPENDSENAPENNNKKNPEKDSQEDITFQSEQVFTSTTTLQSVINEYTPAKKKILKPDIIINRFILMNGIIQRDLNKTIEQFLQDSRTKQRDGILLLKLLTIEENGLFSI